MYKFAVHHLYKNYMKNLLIALMLILLVSSCFTAKVPSKDRAATYPNPFEFTLIDTIPLSKSELFVKASEWLAKSYNNSKAVIQYSDKEAGKIVGKALYQTPSLLSGLGGLIGDETVDYTITIDVKEGKYKCVLSDFIHKGGEHYASGLGLVHSYACGSMNATYCRGEGTIYNKSFLLSKEYCYTSSKAHLQDMKEYMRANKKTDF